MKWASHGDDDTYVFITDFQIDDSPWSKEAVHKQVHSWGSGHHQSKEKDLLSASYVQFIILYGFALIWLYIYFWWKNLYFEKMFKCGDVVENVVILSGCSSGKNSKQAS